MSYDMERDAPYQPPDPCRCPLSAQRVDEHGIRCCIDCGAREDDGERWCAWCPERKDAPVHARMHRRWQHDYMWEMPT